MLNLIKQHICHLFLSLFYPKDWVIIGWYVLLFLKLIKVVPILFYNVLEFIILFYTFLIICFTRYKEYVICPISFSKSSYLFPVFTCARVIGNLWKTCLGVDILGPFPCFTSYLALDAIVV